VQAPSRHTYSTKRLRLVLLLLTAVTLPVVVASSFLIYQYLRYSVMVERRLSGERWQVLSRVYARPLVLREGLVLSVAGLARVLNDLKYEHKADAPAAPGEFALGDKSLLLHPRPGPDAAAEAVVVVFEKDHVKELRGARSKQKYATQTLEPQLITYLFDDTREKRRLVRYEDLPDHRVKAVLGIEDRRFFSHPGLDPFRILGAALRNLRAESYLQGGSTITQQLVTACNRRWAQRMPAAPAGASMRVIAR